MTYVDSQLVAETVRELCIQAATILPGDVLCALEEARQREESSLGKDILGMILENARLAASEHIPICQDTGMAHVFLEIGQNVHIQGEPLDQAVARGVSMGYTQGFLRKSVVRNPLFHRNNTGDNTPPVIHSEIVPGDLLKITVMPKGTGSENMSAICMLSPAQGVDGVAEFVLDVVRNAGANACPPIVVGVGVGGMMDKAAYLAKKALLRDVGVRNQDPEVSQLEKELVLRINRLGIGPGGLGGITTCLDVHIETFPTHIGALPCAVNLQCHAARKASRVIGMTGRKQVLT